MTVVKDARRPEPVNVADVHKIAKEKLSKPVWDYYQTGADDEYTLERNHTAYNDILLRPQMLRNVSNIDTSTTIFGKRYDIPIAVAPSAYQKLVGGEGELDVARAAANLGTNLTLSTNATTSLEDVARAIPERGPDRPRPWFQLYFLGNRDLTAKLIRRAEDAGYEALVLTVDTVILGNRLQERRTPLELPPGIAMANVESRKSGAISTAGLLLRAKTAAEHRRIQEENHDHLVDASLEWREVIPWLRSQTKMKIVLKGILTAEDAQRSVEAGVDAIVVSNHGGRQLDGVPSTIEALPEIVDVVRGRIPVIVDGGITRGTDVFKALALGADLCLIGRTALWGLAWDGQKGVEGVLNILERELARAMALMGVASLKDISRGLLGRARQNGFGVAKL
ncbi:Putative FMN-dependent dehydrogenase, FMN-dependent alpha-hydroxy acid dehydrogenase, active [Colletotrichum destructivum]|uniref:Oxidase FUB9 n=1 Tax=Colletotrichum destructivum TaxID=34406 RepID=A0AAX4ID74_9PEZI|nr:Putative FMN-dependent dehydrogenase, FMN-dependent alpha-hydroxy acid dehydrogenase, active [Colletotrichum destructivum]